MEEIDDDILKRNKNLLWQALLYYLDTGLNYLKREYLGDAANSIQKMTQEQIYDFLIRQNIRKLIKTNLRQILLTAIEFIKNEKSQEGSEFYFDELIDRKFALFAKNDMILLHARKEHHSYSELRTISKFLLRISVFQSIQLLKCRDPKANTYEELVKSTFKTYKPAWVALNSILSMFDRMIDVFENNLDIISIPFYRPTFTLRDFKYVRITYEYSLTILEEEMKRIFNTY